MSTTNSIVPHNLTSLHVQTCHNNPNSFSTSIIFRGRDRRARRSINTATTIYKSRDLVVYSSVQPGGPLDSTGASSGSWKGWILGMLLTVIIPLWRNKWGPLLQLKHKVEEVVQTVEDITEAVEKVADKVEEVAEEAIDKLPAGKLKNAVALIEKAAERISDDAHLADEVIDKLQEVDKEMDAFIDQVTDQANDIAKEANDIAKDANDIVKGANDIAKDTNDIAKGANDIAKDATVIVKDANDIAKDANDIVEEVHDLSKKSS